MKARKALATTLLTAVIATTGMVATAGPAQAKQGKKGDKVAACVKTTRINNASNYYVAILNECKTTVKVKAVMKLGTDHPCVTLKPGKRASWTSNSLKTWSKTVYC